MSHFGYYRDDDDRDRNPHDLAPVDERWRNALDAVLLCGVVGASYAITCAVQRIPTAPLTHLIRFHESRLARPKQVGPRVSLGDFNPAAPTRFYTGI